MPTRRGVIRTRRLGRVIDTLAALPPPSPDQLLPLVNGRPAARDGSRRVDDDDLYRTRDSRRRCCRIPLPTTMTTTSQFRNLSVTAAAALGRDAYAMSHRLGVSTHALLLRPSNHIYAAGALSQSEVHDADRPSPSAALTVLVHMQRTVRCCELRRKGGRRQRARSAI